MERYQQESVVRGEQQQGMQSMRRGGEGERRTFGYDPRR